MLRTTLSAGAAVVAAAAAAASTADSSALEYTPLDLSKYKLDHHLLHTSLRGEGLIEGYELSLGRHAESGTRVRAVRSVATLGHKGRCGHPQVVLRGKRIAGGGRRDLPPSPTLSHPLSHPLSHRLRAVCGHPKLVHGGAIASLLDDTMGTLFLSLGEGNGFTANLNIDYRRPIPAGTRVENVADLDRIETSSSSSSSTKAPSKKVYIRGVIRSAEDAGGEVQPTRVTYTEATALFITKAVQAGGMLDAKAKRDAAAAEDGAAEDARAPPPRQGKIPKTSSDPSLATSTTGAGGSGQDAPASQ
jgi:hypothetical protein